jgi:myo-inositol-1(or 4)-monophosphatase
MNDEDLLQAALKAAKRAGDHSLMLQESVVSEHKKGDSLAKSLVTAADRECERIVRDALLTVFPTSTVIGEEEGGVKSEYTWHVDPIDGTVNYARQSPLWGVNIGLSRGDEPVLGVIAYPALKITLHALKGQGAWRKLDRLKVSSRTLDQALYFDGGVAPHGLWIKKALAKVVGDVRVLGAGSIAFGEVAQGRGEIICGGPSDHDICAGAVIVQEAGGRVTDKDGAPWRLGSQTLVATNNLVHDEVLAVLKDSWR